MTVAAGLATVAVGVLTENADPFRYSFSHLFPAIIILIMTAMTDRDSSKKTALLTFLLPLYFVQISQSVTIGILPNKLILLLYKTFTSDSRIHL